jgi:hypothetical protein
VRRGLAVDRVDHHLLRGHLADQLQPGGHLRFGGVVHPAAVVHAAQEHRLHDQPSPEELHQPYRFCHAGASPGLVDQAHRFVQRRIELEDVVVHLQQCAAHIVTADHRRVAQHRHLCRRTQLVAYGDRVGDDLLELRVHRRFSVAREGNHVGRRSCGGHLPQFRAQQRPHLFARVETGLEAMFAPAAFAVDAVEVAKFVVGGQQVHPERQSESAAVHGTEDDAVEKNGAHGCG